MSQRQRIIPRPFFVLNTSELIADILEDHPFETRLADLLENLTEAIGII